MNQNLSFLTKSIVDEAVAVIDKNGFTENREGTKYAVLINNKRYPYKLLVTEAAKIAKVSLNSNDFKSDEKNRNGFQELTGYPITATRSNEMEYVKFKKLLEYFIAHLEWLVNEDNNNRG